MQFWSQPKISIDLIFGKQKIYNEASNCRDHNMNIHKNTL